VFTSTLSGVSADFKPAPIADVDLTRLLDLLFAEHSAAVAL